MDPRLRELIERHGAPALVVENISRVATKRGRRIVENYGADLEPLNVQAQVLHRTALAGGAKYVLVRRRIEVHLDDVPRLQRRLAESGRRIIEFRRRGDHAVLSLEGDVEPFTEEELAIATSERRVLWVACHREFGDSSIDVDSGGGEPRSTDQGVLLLFGPDAQVDGVWESDPLDEWTLFDELPEVWRFEPTDAEAGWPITPSAAQAEQIDALIAALAGHDWFVTHCRNHAMLPLHSTIIYTWALQRDGVVQWIDHEAFGYPMEPERKRLQLFAALTQGALRYAELEPLVPLRPALVSRCTRCDATGSEDGEICWTCNGLGWR